jgi:hypothetical protein
LLSFLMTIIVTISFHIWSISLTVLIGNFCNSEFSFFMTLWVQAIVHLWNCANDLGLWRW